MENASKAMLIVAGVLIGVMILSLGGALFYDLTTYVQSSQETIRFNELNAFNTQFLQYTTNNNLTIHDVVTAANLANENNISYDVLTEDQIENSRGNPSTLYVAVYLNGTPIEANIQELSAQLLGTNIGKIFTCSENDNSEKSGVKISNATGRVYEVYFREQT